jgi:hypothetical protein
MQAMLNRQSGGMEKLREKKNFCIVGRPGCLVRIKPGENTCEFCAGRR